MKALTPSLCLAVLPLLVACADGTQPPSTATASAAAQPGSEAEWVHELLSAKVAGSLYRSGAFFPHPPATADAGPAWR
jgi:hypothetical protein